MDPTMRPRRANISFTRRLPVAAPDEDSLRLFIAERVTHALATQQVTIGEVMPVHLSPPKTRRRIAVRSAWAGKQFQLGFSTEKVTGS